MRARSTLPTLVVVLFAALAGPSVALAEDTTPPDGHFAINGGDDWTNDTHLDLDVTATDDVGVVTVKVRHGAGDWTTYPYQPHIGWDIDNVGDGSIMLEVEWADEAGNRSGAVDIIYFDNTPPTLASFAETTPGIGPEGTVTFQFNMSENPGFGLQARFSSNGGSTWGAAVALDDAQIAWDPFDVTHGGSTDIGPRTVSAQVRDPAGNWSNVKSDSILALANVSIVVSANPTTGEPITFTPKWDRKVTFPNGIFCSWEFMTGDDSVLSGSGHNETYRYHETEGSASGGWCGPWTFTLPWSPVRKYLVAFNVLLPGGLTIGDTRGGPEGGGFTSQVGSTSIAIKTSNLPLFYVVPDDTSLTVGEPTTWRAIGLGGATIKTSDRWMVVQYGSTFYPGSSTFTFTPTKTGTITVCLARGAGNTPMSQLTACFDPPVKRAAGGTVAASGAPAASTSPSAAAPTETAASSDGPIVTPGAVAIASPGEVPSDTEPPPAAPEPGATSGATTPGGLWAALLVAVVLVVAAATPLRRPETRAAVRSRFRR